jgi:diacylglycerol kinase family enzyme
LKKKVGWLAYVVSGVRAARSAPNVRFTLTFDGSPVVHRRGCGLLVGNVGDLQAGLPVLPGAVPDDGAFEIGLLAARHVRDWLALLVRLVVRRAPRPQQLEVFTAARVDVVVDRTVPLQLDGDVRAPTDRFTAQVLPLALTLCVPPDEPAPAEHQPEDSRAASAGSSGSMPSVAT